MEVQFSKGECGHLEWLKVVIATQCVCEINKKSDKYKFGDRTSLVYSMPCKVQVGKYK